MTVTNRPVGFLDSCGREIYDSVDDLAFQGEYDGSGNLIYKGFARPGSPTSIEVWQLSLLTYDGSGNLLSITWPLNSLGSPSQDYEFEWDDRATYTYV